MATYFARKAGNINASDVWATTPSGTAAAVTFASGDVLMANSFAITVNVTTNLGSTGQVRNDTTGGATTGGAFTLSDGVTLTANVFAGTIFCVGVAASATASLVGNLTGGGTNGRAVTLSNASSTLTITATNLTAGTSSDSNAVYVGSVSANLNLTLSGIVTGGSTSNNPAIRIDGTGIYSITGNSIGGSVNGSFGIQLNNAAAGLNITGNVTGGSFATAYGFNNSLGANPVITGQCIGGVAAPGAFNTTTGSITATRAVGNGFGPGSVGLTAAPGIANSGLGVVTIEQLEYGTLGQSPTTGTGFRLKKVGTNTATFNYCDTVGAKTLIDATANAAMPAATNVRSGVSYASGALTGSCAVPAAGSVALGVPVDATTGTAALTPAAVWEYASRSLTTSSGATAAEIRAEMDANSTKLANLDATVSSRLAPSGTLATVTTLTNAPASVTPAQIRAEMDANSTKLANLDATVSSRLATSGYTAPTSAPTVADIRTELAVELGRLDASVSSRLASSAYTAPTTPPTAAQIATAVEGSLLNEADGQAVLNAIVGAIGNTNLSEVSLVAAVRADLERNGGKLDSIPTTAAPTASTVAGAVRTELGTELGRIDAAVSSRLAPSGTLAVVTTLTNAPTVPTASAIASQVRTELATELGRVDVATSTRLAGSAYTAPANSDIAAIKSKTDNLPASPAATGDIPSANITAIKAKTDLLNTDRLANVATTNIVGTLLAQANS